MNASLSEKISQLPQTPGVYKYLNDKGEVIYVGKAKNLKSRVGSYFHLNTTSDNYGVSKTAALVSRINDIEYINVDSEFEALILEAELIKKYKPKYNIIQKDDKTYLFIVIRNEQIGSYGKYSKIITARKTELKKGDIKFGPYTDSYSAKFVLRALRKVFPYRDCSVTKFLTQKKLNKPCLFGQIGLCFAPCVDQSHDNINKTDLALSSIKKVLKGGSSKIITSLKRQMKKHAANHEYETAAIYRDLLNKFDYVRTRFRLPESYMENPTLIQDRGIEALEDLKKILPFAVDKLETIECYDISNISGKEAVGSLVTAKNGLIDKRFYKKFKIKFKNSPDDFEMIHEVISRRLKRDSWGIPDLLVVDGGKGQVSAALEAANSIGKNVNIIGLAKREETIVYNDGHSFVELKVSKDSPGLKLLITLRDESHRFAQAYHHKLRLKKIRE